MREIKILHSADWHLDSPFESLSSAQAKEMRFEARDIPFRIRRIAEEQKADMIVLSGDLFDSDLAYLESARVLSEAFKGMDIPVFIAPGNHDALTSPSAYDRIAFPENVHIFRKNRMEKIETPLADVYGAAFTDSFSGDLLRDFRADKTSGKYSIVVMHGEIGTRGVYSPVTEEEIASSGADYIALGHIHKRTPLLRAGNTWYAYPGCPMGRGFDETGTKGVYLVTLSESGCRADFIETAHRRYETYEVPVDENDAEEKLREAVSAAREGDICRFVLSGCCALPPDGRTLQALAAEKRLFAAFLRDKTVPPVKVSDNEFSLRAELLRVYEEEASAAEPEEREKLDRALTWALAVLDGREEPREVRV